MPQISKAFGSRRMRVLGALSLALAACAPDAPHSAPVAAAYADWPDPLAAGPHGAAQTAGVCGRAGDGAVRDVFCSTTPSIASLADLEAAFKVGSDSISALSLVGKGTVTALAITGQSTGLSARSVSAINPRLIAIRAELAPFQLLALAFTRGEQFVELIAQDRVEKSLHFYLVGFQQACNHSKEHCAPGDLLTPAIDRDWTEVSLYDEHDLANTVLDCAPDVAIARLRLPARDLLAMPPARVRVLSEEARNRAIAALLN